MNDRAPTPSAGTAPRARLEAIDLVRGAIMIVMALGLWAPGWAMILLSALVRLPAAVATSIGLVVIAGHNLFDRVRSAHPIWSLLHSPNFLLNTPEHVVSVCRWFARLKQRRTEAWLSYYLSAPR